MSLNNEIDNKDSYVRRFMDAWFPDLPAVARVIGQRLRACPLIHPASYDSRHLYMIVGTATDYRFRACFDPKVHQSTMVQEGLKYASQMFWPGFKNTWKPRKRGSPARTFVQAYEDFIAGIDRQGTPLDHASEDRLARFCFWFAHLDAFNRSRVSAMFSPPGFLHTAASSSIEAMLATVPDPVVDDIIRLARGFRARYEDTIAHARTVYLGQPLAAASLTGGADFDLVVDGTLYEFKTTLRPQGIPKILRQVAGYWLLDRDDALTLHRAVVEFARQEHAESFDIASGLLGITDPATVRRLFHDGATTGIVPPIQDDLRLAHPLLVPARLKPIWEEPVAPAPWVEPLPVPKPRSWVEPNGTIIIEDEPDPDPPVRRGRPPLYGRAMTPAERTKHARLRRKQNEA